MKTLSDKRGYFPRTHQVIYLEEDVKQFIKDLMDLWGYSYDGSISMMGDDIIRLAGNKLIEEKEE